MSKRLNYKECRENVFKLLEKTSTLSKQEIWNTIGLGYDMDYIYDYMKFPTFLNHTREYAFKEYFKAKNERIPLSNIFTLKSILNKNNLFIPEYLQFCEIERIPLLYYVHQIKKYIFPNEQLYVPIINRLSLITIKSFIGTLKRGEIFGFISSINDIIELLSKNKVIGRRGEAVLYLKSFIRKNYIYGESKDQMLERLEYTKDLKELNEEIDKNLYSIVDLELYDGNSKLEGNELKLWKE